MIVRRGKTSKATMELVLDLRRVMAPNTTERLRSSASTSLKELLQAAGVLKLSHLVTVSETAQSVHLRVARLPSGPTLTFRVDSYTLSRHVRDEQQRPPAITSLKTPLLVANNFSRASEARTKLVRATLEAMFPALDVTTVKLADCRRVVLCQLVDDDVVDIRHYLIRADLAGVSKPVKDLVRAAKTPDLSTLDDVADYVLGGASIPRADEGATVVLPDRFTGRGNSAHRTSAIALTEIGPRLTLRLLKIEKDVAQGDVLFRAPAAAGPS
uniref:Brix domain-containing protein n=1 Tax=Chrysocystis fragilis TaxID=1411660 RepID=A0A7S0XM90_9STRA